jgi:hypothetical protein
MSLVEETYAVSASHTAASRRNFSSILSAGFAAGVGEVGTVDTALPPEPG